MAAIVRIVAKAVMLLVIAVALVATIVPRFLDRLYYRGPATDHFNGARFANPDGDDDTARAPGGSRLKFFWNATTGRDGRPNWPDTVPIRAATPAELSPAALKSDTSAPPMRATWIGHATVLLQIPGLNILTDPVWSERTGPFGRGPKRVAAPGIALADLPRIDLILLSHNHYDHFDLPTLERLWRRDRPLIVTSLGNDAILRTHGIEAVAADWRQAVPVAGHAARVHVTRNHHWGSRWFTDRNRALWSSFVVTLPGGNLFFAGDTGMGDGRWPAEAAALGPIRLALIPIGAFRFAPGQMASGSHIGPAQAAQVFERLGAATAIPIHWGTFRLSYEGYRTPALLLGAAMRCTHRTGFAPVPIGRPQDIPPIMPRPVPLPTPDADLARCLSTPSVQAMR